MKPAHAKAALMMRVLAAASVTLVAGQIYGATYQVGPARTYTNLQAIAKRLAPGDVVEVDGDAVYPGNATFDNHGTPANPITIRGVRVNGKRPVISGVNGFARGAVVGRAAAPY